MSAAISAAQIATVAADRVADPAQDDAPAPPAGRTLMHGAARSLLVTPWFAASAGVVIAAALWIHAPHTTLRFPNSTPQTQVCTGQGCNAGGSGGEGQPAASSPGQAIKDPRQARRQTGARRTAERAASGGLTFTYRLVQHGHQFSEVISLSGRDLPAAWALTFEIVGTHISRVVGTHWELWASENGGKASPARSRHFGWSQRSDEVTFEVFGSGTARSPVSCTFDGDPCSFSPAPASGLAGYGQGGRHGRGDHRGFGRNGGYRTDGAFGNNNAFGGNHGRDPQRSDRHDRGVYRDGGRHRGRGAHRGWQAAAGAKPGP